MVETIEHAFLSCACCVSLLRATWFSCSMDNSLSWMAVFFHSYVNSILDRRKHYDYLLASCVANGE